MAAISVGTGGKTYSQVDNSDRNCVETASGNKYIAIINVTDDKLEMWKSTDGGATFSKVGTSPDGWWGCSIAIDGANPQIISVVYIGYSGDLANTWVRHCTFNTSTDAWGTPETIDSGFAWGISAISICFDASNIPHVAYSMLKTGQANYTVWYANRIGGSWNAPVEVEGDGTAKNCKEPSIAIDVTNSGVHRYNIPQIAYANITDQTQKAALGNQNNAASFTLVNPASLANYGTTCSLAVDENGRTNILFRRLVIRNVYIDGDGAWGTAGSWTGETPLNENHAEVSLAIVGTNRYCFYKNDSDGDIDYTLSSAYGAFPAATELDAGTFTEVKARWQYANNPVNSVDWVFSTGSAVYFDTLSLAAAYPIINGADIAKWNNAALAKWNNSGA